MNEQRQKLWTDFFLPVAAESAIVRQEFAVVRRGGRPWLYLPTSRRAAARALALYPAQSSKARLAKRLLALGLRTAPPRLLGLEIFPMVFSPGDPFANFLSRTAGFPAGRLPVFAVLRGNPNAAGRRDVFLLFDAVEQPVAVIKAGDGDAARRLIAHEESLLKSLPLHATGAPRVRSSFSAPQAAAFAMDFVPGESPTGAATAEVGNILNSWLDAAREIPLAELPAGQRLLGAAAGEALPEPVRSLSELRLRPTLIHGDFAPWNVKVARGQWTVLDWERGELVGVPGWDWFHFVMQPAVLVRRERTGALLARFESLLDSAPFSKYAKRAGISEHGRALALAYLAYCTRVTRQTEGGERVRELERAAAARWFPERR